MDPLAFLISLLPHQYAMLALDLIGVCAILDAAIPQPGPGSRWVRVRRVIALVGANWGWASNKFVAGSLAARVERLKRGAARRLGRDQA